MTTAKDHVRGTKKKLNTNPASKVGWVDGPSPKPPSWESSNDHVLYQAYHLRVPGGMWFSPNNMRAFGTVVKDVWWNPVTTDYLFITRETRRHFDRRNTSHHTLRWMNAAGKIENVTPLVSSYTDCAKVLTSIVNGKRQPTKHTENP